MSVCYSIVDGSIHLTVKVIPGASKTEIVGVKDGRLRIKVASVPEKGKANSELVSFIAKTIDCTTREVNILRGEKNRQKILVLPIESKDELEKICGKEQVIL
jgi:uncharacterized protein (TIGR00251 family)